MIHKFRAVAQARSRQTSRLHQLDFFLNHFDVNDKYLLNGIFYDPHPRNTSLSNHIIGELFIQSDKSGMRRHEVAVVSQMLARAQIAYDILERGAFFYHPSKKDDAGFESLKKEGEALHSDIETVKKMAIKATTDFSVAALAEVKTPDGPGLEKYNLSRKDHANFQLIQHKLKYFNEAVLPVEYAQKPREQILLEIFEKRLSFAESCIATIDSILLAAGNNLNYARAMFLHRDSMGGHKSRADAFIDTRLDIARERILQAGEAIRKVHLFAAQTYDMVTDDIMVTGKPFQVEYLSKAPLNFDLKL